MEAILSQENSHQETQQPLLGVFWAVPQNLKTYKNFKLITYGKPATDIPDIGGFKTLDDGHDLIWQQEITSKRVELKPFGYEFFPRGRINFIAGSGHYLILIDRFFASAKWLKQIKQEFNLQQPTCKVMLDAHYQTRFS